MKQLKSVHDLIVYRKELRTRGLDRSVGFVPTMGALHEGHGSLLERARSENDVVVLSVFVNPTQFNNPSDLEHYPRTLEADLKIAESKGVDAVFLPSQEQLYPDGYTLRVQEHDLANQLEGAHRPGHFDGVLTVVAKLLGLVQPARLYLGKKDYQQCLMIQKLVRGLFIETEIVVCPVVREPSGLAMSSRNQRLSDTERKHAALISEFGRSALNSPTVCAERLTAAGFKVDYVVDQPDAFNPNQHVRLIAATIGPVRLIDCIELKGPMP